MENNDLHSASAAALNPLTGLFGATLTDFFIIGGILINSDNYRKIGQHNSWSISFRCNKNGLPNESSRTEYNVAIERILKQSGYKYAFRPVTRHPSGFIATLLFQNPFEFSDLLHFVEKALNRDEDESKAYASALLSGVLDGKVI